MENLSSLVEDLIIDYHDLNSSQVDEFNEEPSALEFMRYVAKNRPFVVRNGAQNWNAVRAWNVEYLKRTMDSQPVKVAITPKGNADSVLEIEEDMCWFVKPYEIQEAFEVVVDKIQRQERGISSGPVRYAQTQNDNLRGEYDQLFNDVPKSIAFARIALQREPDAINFWLGNSYSITALHKDPYENIYVQIIGQKHFIILPPVEAPCTNERLLPAATYCPVVNDDSDPNLSLKPELDNPAESIPFATWDPDKPGEHATRFSRCSQPMRVTLNAGDMLYLPALWYHKVSQSCGEEGICCAVNYWYDMEFAGSFYPLCAFARKLGQELS